ncbi:MAG: hypothetical protein ACJAZT_001403 [Gammaproteobacteria bacterium]
MGAGQIADGNYIEVAENVTAEVVVRCIKGSDAQKSSAGGKGQPTAFMPALVLTDGDAIGD